MWVKSADEKKNILEWGEKKRKPCRFITSWRSEDVSVFVWVCEEARDTVHASRQSEMAALQWGLLCCLWLMCRSTSSGDGDVSLIGCFWFFITIPNPHPTYPPFDNAPFSRKLPRDRMQKTASDVPFPWKCLPVGNSPTWRRQQGYQSLRERQNPLYWLAERWGCVW